MKHIATSTGTAVRTTGRRTGDGTECLIGGWSGVFGTGPERRVEQSECGKDTRGPLQTPGGSGGGAGGDRLPAFRRHSPNAATATAATTMIAYVGRPA